MATKHWKIRKFAPKVTEAETIFFHRGLARAKLPFETQKYVRGASGKVYLVDGVVTPNIIVEVDGGSHNDPRQQIKDMERDRDLREAGWIVIRFRNWEIYKQLGKCVAAVKELHKRHGI